MQYLLDTNTCIAVMRNQAQVVARIQCLLPRDCAISTITSFELLTGIEKCAQPVQERAKVEALLTAVSELVYDSAAAHESAKIRAHLESRGMSIGPYDLLLAGQAIAGGRVLVTHNVREFVRVAGLVIDDWQATTGTAGSMDP